MLRGVKSAQLTPMNQRKLTIIIDMCANSYVRFGTYGEPSLLDVQLVKAMALSAKSWTGYTHQWNKEWANEYAEYFMASTHNKEETYKAKLKNYRSFIASTTGTEEAVTCPASAEAGFKSNCASCGLCSGTLGKGKKDIKIFRTLITMNIYEQAAEQAKIDKQQQMLNKKVEYDLLKSKENRLLERLDNLGIKYKKGRYYDFSEEKFLGHIHNDCTIRYEIYLYTERVKR